MEDAKVLLFLKPRGHNPGARITQKAETTTDDTGAYDFGDLAPGEYFLAVSAQPWYALHHSAAGTHQRPESDPSTALDVAYPVTFFDTTTDEATKMNSQSHEEPIPLMQKVLDNPFLLLFLGVMVPMVVYTLWGVIEILTVPLAK